MTITQILQSKVQTWVHRSGGLNLGKAGTSLMRWDIEGIDVIISTIVHSISSYL